MKSLLLLWLICATPVWADGFSQAENAYRDGRFAVAAQLGENLGTAAGDALAARAHLVLAAYLAPPEDRLRHLADAEAAVRRALIRDPDHVEAMLHLVIAMGYKARGLSPLKAHRAGLGREAKTLIAWAEALAPNDPWVHAIKGGWQGEIIATAGGLLGRLFYGVSMAGFRASFQRAQELAPDNPAIKVEYAKLLLRIDAADHGGEAAALLRQAAALPPADAFQALLQEQGNRLLAAQAQGDPARLADLLLDMTPFARDRR